MLKRLIRYTCKVCFIDMKVQRLEKKMVFLRPKNLTMDQPLDMNLFIITDYALIYTNITNDDERVRVAKCHGYDG